MWSNNVNKLLFNVRALLYSARFLCKLFRFWYPKGTYTLPLTFCLGVADIERKEFSIGGKNSNFDGLPLSNLFKFSVFIGVVVRNGSEVYSGETFLGLSLDSTGFTILCLVSELLIGDTFKYLSISRLRGFLGKEWYWGKSCWWDLSVVKCLLCFWGFLIGASSSELTQLESGELVGVWWPSML